MANERYTSIQALRGLAALCVVFHHAALLGGSDALSAPSARTAALAEFCSCGVDIFFVISGFVMANSIGGGSRRQSPGGFLLRRAARVFPLFWILSAALIVQALKIGHNYPFASYLNTLTLVPVFDRQVYDYPPLYVAWSLGYEMIFYMMVAAILWRAPRRPIGALLVLVVISTTLGAISGYISPPVAFVANPIFAEFGLGILAWLITRQGLPAAVGMGMIVVGVPFLISGLFIDFGQGFSVDPTQIVTGVTSLKRALVWGLPSALIVCGAASTTGLSPRWLTRMGDASYSLYLIHPIVIVGLAHAMWSRPLIGSNLMIVASCATSIVAAFAIHAWVERPLMATAVPAITTLWYVIARRRMPRHYAAAELAAD